MFRIPTIPIISYFHTLLAASTRASAAHAAIAASISGHNRTADVAAGGVTQIDELFQRVGGVVNATVGHGGAVAGRICVAGQAALRRTRLTQGLAEG